ncbi:MAG: hypothetical protein F6J93_35170 [Oscillatoria sp. SIO1A7]|nr:hypothetical protein [Oscillatoria sp. SIO1A7]
MLSAFSLSVKALPIQDVGVLQLSNTLIGSAIIRSRGDSLFAPTVVRRATPDTPNPTPQTPHPTPHTRHPTP